MKGIVSIVGYQDNAGLLDIMIKSDDKLLTSAVLLAATMQLSKDMGIPFGFLLNGWKEMSEGGHAKEI